MIQIKKGILGVSMFAPVTAVFQKTMKKFLQTNYSIQYYLDRLSKMIKELEDDHQIFYEYFEKSQNSIHLFKLLILLHYCVITKVQLQSEKIFEILKSAKMKSHGTFELYLQEKVNQHYVVYLQKRIHYEALKDQKDHFEEQNGQEYYLAKSYMYINFLRVGLTFSQSLYTLGRYYSRKYEYFCEFNKILGRDFRQLYQKLAYNISFIENLSDEFETIIHEVQVINEKLYSIYYNCYFSRLMVRFLPEWIQTDIEEILKVKREKNLSNCSTACRQSRFLKKKADYEENVEQLKVDKEKAWIKLKQMSNLKELEQIYKEMVGSI